MNRKKIIEVIRVVVAHCLMVLLSLFAAFQSPPSFFNTDGIGIDTIRVLWVIFLIIIIVVAIIDLCFKINDIWRISWVKCSKFAQSDNKSMCKMVERCLSDKKYKKDRGSSCLYSDGHEEIYPVFLNEI